MIKVNWNTVVRNVIIVILVFIITRLNYTIKNLKSKIKATESQIRVVEVVKVVEREELNSEIEVVESNLYKNSAKMRITAYCACTKCCRT